MLPKAQGLPLKVFSYDWNVSFVCGTCFCVISACQSFRVLWFCLCYSLAILFSNIPLFIFFFLYGVRDFTHESRTELCTAANKKIVLMVILESEEWACRQVAGPLFLFSERLAFLEISSVKSLLSVITEHYGFILVPRASQWLQAVLTAHLSVLWPTFGCSDILA